LLKRLVEIENHIKGNNGKLTQDELKYGQVLYKNVNPRAAGGKSVFNCPSRNLISASNRSSGSVGFHALKNQKRFLAKIDVENSRIYN